VTKTVVIGAGVGGLATAALLAREGHDVVVLERLDSVGGRVGVVERNGFRFDTGPSWYLMPRVYDHFFAMLGTTTAEQLELRTLDPAYAVFPEPDADAGAREPVTVPFGRDNVRAVFEALEPGAGARLDTYLDSAQSATGLAERRFLYNPFTRLRSLASREVIRSSPRLFGLLGTSLESYVARRFRHPVIRQILGYPAVFLATRPSDAPALYHLMSALDLDDGVLYPMGGFGAVVEAFASLATHQGARIVTGADVVRIDTSAEPRGASGRMHTFVTGVTWHDRAGVEHFESADIVVSAADLHHTETRLLSGADQTFNEAWWERRVSGPGAVLVLLGVSGTLPELPHHSLFFAKDWDANFEDIFGDAPRVPDPPSVYVCKPSATDPSVAPRDHENLFVLIPVPADPQLGKGGTEGGGDARVEAIADAVIDQIGRWAAIPGLRERIVVRETIGPRDFAEQFNSWHGGMLGPAHTLRQSAMFRAQNASKRVEGLYFAGATTAPGVGVPMCLISAELVLKRIRGNRTAGPLAEPGLVRARS